jgi:hypothetical protein
VNVDLAEPAAVKPAAVEAEAKGEEPKPSAKTSAAPTIASVDRPTIASIDPARSIALGGVRVVITGEHFDESARVEIGGAVVGAKLEDGALVALSPPSVHAGKVDVRVTTDGGSAVLERGFEYVAQTGPSVASIDPSSGPASGGTSVTVAGANFVEGAVVEMAGLPTTIERFAADAIVFVTPPHPTGGMVEVRVRNPDGQSATTAFAYARDGSAGPKITRITPKNGPARGGTRVILVGEGLVEGTRVDFGGQDVAATMEHGDLVVTSPKRASGGAIWVRVTRPDGAFDVAHDAFTYDEPLPSPKIGSISPAQHVLGRDVPITLEGEHFQDGCLVGFDGRDVAATFESSKKISAVPPPHSAGVVEVRVVNPDGGVDVRANAFEYVLPPAGPAIVGVRPNKGSMLGGTTVMLHGTGFQPGARIELSGLEVRTKVHDGNTIEITPPPKPASCFVDVAVINPDGTSFTLPAGFFYERLAAPVIEGVEPLKGPASGGTEVTIHGQNFVAHAHTSVRFGERAATIVKTTSTSILVRTPAGEPRLVDVTVKLPDDQSVTTKNVFKYEAVPPPELTTVTPKYGSAQGGERVTLLGKNFIEGTAVIMGGVECKRVKIVDSKTIECTAPPQSSPGMVDVVVKIPTGASATMKLAFQYTR